MKRVRQLSGDFSRREERNLNCTFVRVNFKESCVKTSARMTEIPFSYTRDKATFSFILWKEGISSRRHEEDTNKEESSFEEKPPTTYCESSLSFILHAKSSSGPILNFSNCDDRAKNILQGPVEPIIAELLSQNVGKCMLTVKLKIRSYSWIDI